MAQNCHQRMAMRMYLAGLFLSLSVIGVYSDCPVNNSPTCNIQTLQCCDKQFQTTLGLSNCTGAFWYEPECHQAELEQLYTQGTQGLFKVCSAFSAFYQCLGPSSADCTSIKFHMANGMDLPSALQLGSIYREYGFACGGGLDAFVNADKCMSTVFTKQSAKIANCRSTFSKNLRADWGQRCTFYSEFTGCFQTTFRNSCGPEAGWWGCEYARQGARTQLHDCYQMCSGANPLTNQKSFMGQREKKN